MNPNAGTPAGALPSDDEARRLRRRLLRWFRANRRSLPFRDGRDPWRIWISEVMLQQTRVEAMLPRYRAFVARFPDPSRLAAAPVDEALAAWSGLGYYDRARSLHRAARRLAASGGGIPRTAEALRRLPGVGEYTAAAIASMAFGQPDAAVDGNVRRVLARLFAIRGVPGRAAFEKPIRAAADRLMAADQARSPGEWNQALMELGALVCTPAAPRCGPCPVRPVCRARAEGVEQRLPESAPRPAPVAVRLAQAAIRDREGRLLVFRREESPLRGLYELPGGECREREAPGQALVRAAAARYRLRVTPERALPGFRHTVMNRRIEVFPFEARCRKPPAPGAPEALWVPLREMGRLPCGSLVGKTLARLPTGGEAAPSPRSGVGRR